MRSVDQQVRPTCGILARHRAGICAMPEVSSLVQTSPVEEEEEEPAPEQQGSTMASAEYGPTQASRAFPFRPGARELLGLALAIATARGAKDAEELDVVLAALVRPSRTTLDRSELGRGATSALVQVIPEQRAERITSALSAAGVPASGLGNYPDASPADPRLAAVVEKAYELVGKLSGSELWSHHMAAAALADAPLPDAVLQALGVTQDRMRAALRRAIATRWPTESPAVWDDVLGRLNDTGVPWADDAPARKDMLHRGALADVLADRLQQMHDDAPGVSFLVHIDGSWGVGKSTLLNFLDDRLKNSFLIVRFNAWQQSRIGPPWWTLLTATRQAIAGGRGWWGKRRLRMSETYARIRRTGALYSLALLILVVAIALATYALWPHRITAASGSAIAQAVTAIAAAVAVLWAGSRVAAQFLLWDSAGGARLFEKSGISPMREISSQFNWLIGQAPPADQAPQRNRPRSPRPVIFFIDDLDRCDSSYVVDFLDSVQTLVRDAATPAGKNDRGAMFVVAADGAWLRVSYEGTYQSFSAAIGQPGRPLGYVFLDKIFQLRMPLPTPHRAAQQDLLDGLLGVRHPASDSEIAEQIDATEKELDSARGDRERVRAIMQAKSPQVTAAVSGYAARILMDPATVSRTEHKLQKFADLLDGNPRTTKLFLNTFTVIEAIRALEAEFLDFNTLALWSIICVRWPEMADYLQQRPDAITHIINSPTSDDFPERLKAAALLPELRSVIQYPQGGPLTAELVSRCTGSAVAGSDT